MTNGRRLCRVVMTSIYAIIGATLVVAPIVSVGLLILIPLGAPPSTPPSTPIGCTENCSFQGTSVSGDGDCDDGGSGSTFDVCDHGTDCADCGVRHPPPPSSPRPSPSPSSSTSPIGCTENCSFQGTSVSGDGDCDDGGSGSTFDVCDHGTDCADCGVRHPPPPPPPATPSPPLSPPLSPSPPSTPTTASPPSLASVALSILEGSSDPGVLIAIVLALYSLIFPLLLDWPKYHLSRYLRAIKPVRQACGAPTTSTTAGDLGLAERQAEEKAQAAVGDESRADTTHVALAVQPQAMQRGDEESVNGAEVSVAEVAVQGVASESAFLGGTLDLNDVVSMRVTELRYVHPLRMLILIFSMLKKAVKIFDRLIRLSRLPVLLSFPLSILFYVVYDRVRAFVSAIFAPFRILSHLFLFEIEVNFDVDVPGAFGKLTSFFSAKPLHVLIELTTKDGKVVPFLARDRRHWLQKSLDFEVGGYLSISTLADDELVMWTEADYNEYCTERSTFDPSSVLFQAGYLCVLGGAILVILFITDMADCLIIISTTEVSQCVTSFLPEVIPLPSGFFLPSGVISVFVLPAILFVTASILRWNKVRFDISFFRDGSRTALSLVSKDGVTVSTMQLEVGKTESYISYVRKRTEAEEYDYFTSTINFFSCLFCFPAFFLVRLLRCYTMGCNAALCSAVRPSDFNDRLSLFCYVCGVRQRAVDALRGYFFAKRHQIIGPPRSSIKRLGNYVCLSDAKGQYDANCNHEGQLSRTEWFDQHRSYWDKYHLGYNYRWPKPYGLWWWGCERRMVADAMYADPNCLRTCAHRSCCKDGLYDSRDSPDGIVAIGLDSWRQFHAIELVPSTTLPAPATSYRPESSAIAIPKQNDGIVENVDPGGNHHVIIRGGPPTTEAFRRYNPDALWKPDEWKVHIEDLSRFYHYVPHRLQPTDCVQIKEFRFDKFGGKMNVIAPLETPPKALEQPLFPGIITFTATDPMSFAIFPRFGDVTGLPSLPINISDTAQSAGMPTLGSAHSISAVGQQLASTKEVQVAQAAQVTLKSGLGQLASTKEVQAAQAAQVTLKSGLTLKGDADELLQDAADRRSRDKLKQLGFHKVNMPDSIFEASFPARATAKQKLSVLLYCLNEMAEELAD